MPADAVVTRFYGSGPLRDGIVNWPEVAWAGLERLRRDANEIGEPLVDLVARVEAWLTGVPRPRRPGCEGGLAVCPVFRFGGHEVRTVSTITRFESAIDVGLDELRIEHVFPADDGAETLLRSLAGG